MQIAHLSLTNFRNYGRLELDVPAGVTLLHGPNAQGKTNLLESIYYLATTRSPYADNDQQILNWEADQGGEPITVGRLVARLTSQSGDRLIELRLIKEVKRGQLSFRREALIDRRKVRLIDLLGKIRVVLFIPSDVALVTGSPTLRRRYLDISLCQTDPIYCRSLSSYNKVLEQRNAALKRVAEAGLTHEVVKILTDDLVALGSEIYMRRARFMNLLALETQRIHYERLTAGRETIRLGYLPRLVVNGLARGDDERISEFNELADWLVANADIGLIAERFKEVVESNYERDLSAGTTTIGPHRDDWRFWVNGRSLSSYGSRGQQRSAILALKMAEITRMHQETAEMPILLLDEVVAELDESRRQLLLEYVSQGSQAILTATDPAMFSTEFLDKAAIMSVRDGRITIVNVPQ